MIRKESTSDFFFFLLFLLFYFFLSSCLIKVTEGLFLERYGGCFYSFLFIGASLAPGIQSQSRFASFACMEGQALASPSHDCTHFGTALLVSPLQTGTALMGTGLGWAPSCHSLPMETPCFFAHPVQ